MLPGLTPACQWADLASHGLLTASGAFCSLEPEDHLILLSSAAHGPGAPHATRALPSVLFHPTSQVGVTATLPNGTPHLQGLTTAVLSSCSQLLAQAFPRVLDPPPTKVFSGCTKDSWSGPTEMRECHPHPTHPPTGRGERPSSQTTLFPPGVGRSQLSPIDVEPHDTISAIHHCILGFTRPNEMWLSGKGGFGARGAGG